MDIEEYRSENLKASKAENILPGRFILNGVNKQFFPAIPSGALRNSIKSHDTLS
jgi:hypothetical protein